jgi:hypothetical protein
VDLEREAIGIGAGHAGLRVQGKRAFAVGKRLGGFAGVGRDAAEVDQALRDDLRGRADALATPAAIEAQFSLAGSPDKTLVMLGKEDGMAMDYGHGDLLYGTGVPIEVHPPIRDWLVAHAHPLIVDLQPAAPAVQGGA